MKNLIIFLIPLLFFACKKEELPIAISEGTKLVKKEFFLNLDQSLTDNPDEIWEYFYDDQERLIGIDRYMEDLSIPRLKYRKEYDDYGNLKLMSSSILRDGDYELNTFYKIYTNPETQQIENISRFFVPNEGGDPQKSYKRHLIYNEYNQIVLDTVTHHNYGASNPFPVNFKYYWENNNVTQIEKFTINGKLVAGEELKYDDKNNPDNSNHIKALYMQYSAIIPIGLNNVIELKHYEFTGSGPRRTCNTCRTTYKYNSSGFPYYSVHENRYRIIYTYEKE